MAAADCTRFRSCPETVVAPAALNNHQNLAAFTTIAALSRARGGGAPMMALAARCELRGGARQQSRFNNCGEGGGYPACVRSQISGWRDRGLYPLARVAAEESGAGLGWRRRWWGDGAMAAPALSCRVGRERELDRSCAGGVRCWREQAHVGLNRPRPHVGQAGGGLVQRVGGLVQRVGAFRRRSVPTCSGLIV